MTASLLLLVLTCNGLGKFTVSVDQSSSFYLTVNLHPELAESDHGGLFLFVSAGLVFIASVGIIPLRSSSVNLILISVLFGFTSAKASLGWAFPLTMVIVLLILKIFIVLLLGFFPNAYCFLAGRQRIPFTRDSSLPFCVCVHLQSLSCDYWLMACKRSVEFPISIPRVQLGLLWVRRHSVPRHSRSHGDRYVWRMHSGNRFSQRFSIRHSVYNNPVEGVVHGC